jgi:serine phosphatase RsbU (regulator of sigma subunit)
MDLITRSYDLGVYDFIKKPEHTEVMLKRVENGLKIGEMLAFNDLIRLELGMARKLQTFLFPPHEVHGNGFSLHGWSRPLADIGGDLYDWVHFRDERIIFFVADVSGHSISAALFTFIVKMIFRNAIKYTVQPDEIMTIMNQELSAHIPTESFVTMFCGIMNPEDRVLRYANAGHPKPFIVKNDEKRILDGNNSFLGPIPNASFDGYECALGEGERLVIFTDGILDRINLQNSLKARKVLEEMINSRESAESIIERVNEFVQSEPEKIIDDCTLMIIDIHHG